MRSPDLIFAAIVSPLTRRGWTLKVDRVRVNRSLVISFARRIASWIDVDRRRYVTMLTLDVRGWDDAKARSRASGLTILPRLRPWGLHGLPICCSLLELTGVAAIL